jgi:hypothetical protein
MTQAACEPADSSVPAIPAFEPVTSSQEIPASLAISDSLADSPATLHREILAQSALTNCSMHRPCSSPAR